MNKQPIRGVEPGSAAEDQIAEHLIAHPDFFERHPGALARLQLPHQNRSVLPRSRRFVLECRRSLLHLGALP